MKYRNQTKNLSAKASSTKLWRTPAEDLWRAQNIRKDAKSSLRRPLTVLILLALFLLLEPVLVDTLTFAFTPLEFYKLQYNNVKAALNISPAGNNNSAPILTGFTYVDQPQVSSELLQNTTDFNKNLLDSISTPPKPIQKSRAPEFSSLFLFLSGAIGVFVRFVRKSFERLKRMIDVFFALVGLVFASPIIFVAGLLIKLTSRGPIIYRQERVGRFGQVFKIYKLRTMHVDAEKETGAVWAKINDSRITAVGRVLRKTHLDEIPQLLNVLKGEMSIVGPRPERPELVRDLKALICDYEKRLLVKPGITGLAQVWHKYDETIEDVKKKIKYDLLYIKKMCLLVDLRILANTVIVVLTGRGAR
jgi:lipopolysaccharide/colanic/teichoic acid biosynthesis glycosyltransferase